MEAVPVAIPVAIPVALIEARDGALELQVTNAVKSWVLPSLKDPVAKNASDAPLTTAELAGAMVIPVSCEEGTVMVVLPQIDPAQAETVAVPAATP